MVVGTGRIILHLEGCRSLKAKRKVVKAMTTRLANAFNLSVAEIGAQNNHQQAEIGFAVVGQETRFVNSQVDKILNLAESLALAQIVETETEILIA